MVEPYAITALLDTGTARAGLVSRGLEQVSLLDQRRPAQAPVGPVSTT